MSRSAAILALRSRASAKRAEGERAIAEAEEWEARAAEMEAWSLLGDTEDGEERQFEAALHQVLASERAEYIILDERTPTTLRRAIPYGQYMGWLQNLKIGLPQTQRRRGVLVTEIRIYPTEVGMAHFGLL